MSGNSGPDVRWGVRKRLEFLEFRLYWTGRFNRSDLSEKFGISPQQASADVSLYENHAPGNLNYDSAQKAFVRSDGFIPRFVERSTDRYLLQLVAVESGWMDLAETWFDVAPPIDVVMLGRRATDHRVLLGILDAIRDSRAASIDYQSMTGTPESWRLIAPHALAYCAGRWYVRAWSEDHNDFRDYNLSRIKGVRELRACAVNREYDYEWSQKIDLVVVPNPNLSPERQNAVASEYDMVDGARRIPVRLSVSFYLMSEHNLDVQIGVLSPLKQQIVLENREDVEAARRLARTMSIQALKREQQT